eukprot:c32187_g1_i1.p1 GENE.c32187_g1_i1~~c32187_g1_i1.p1  ORF type:complete len:794 (-),score=146.32 c32187_g1_i1:17-2194(-)
MGEKEWIVAEGPEQTPTVPKWIVQGQQRGWPNCGVGYPHITVLKDIAIKCGNFNFLLNTPQQTHGCAFNPWAEMEPKVYVRGSIIGGPTFDGSQNLLHNDWFRRSKTWNFGTGTSQQGTLFVETNLCDGNNKCWPNTNNNVLRIQLTCARARTIIQMIGPYNPYSYVDLSLEVPTNDVSSGISVGDTRTLLGGYCGGWHPSVGGALSTAMSACLGSFHNRDCQKSFQPASYKNSLFAAWEYWSNGQFNSINDNKQQMQEAATFADFSQARYDQMVGRCNERFTKITTTFQYKSVPTNPMERLINQFVRDCATDEYYGLAWDDATMKKKVCEMTSGMIHQERRDVFCATKVALSTLSDLNTNTQRAGIAKNEVTCNQIEFESKAFLSASTEVQSSLQNILFWRIPSCDSVLTQTSFAGINCDNWVFADTKNSMGNTAAIKKRKIHMGFLTKVDHRGEMLDVFDAFTDPVVFLGAPTLSDASPSVLRLMKVDADIKVFAQGTTCTSYVKQKESASYIVLENGFDYGSNFAVLTRSVNMRSWTNINWGKAISTPRVFVTIQSANNNACNTCSDKKAAPSGFVYVRVRNVQQSSCDVFLDVDSSSRGGWSQAETIGVFVAAGSARGVFRDVNYASGNLQTTATTAVDVAMTTTVNSFSIPDIDDSPVDVQPVVLVQAITFNDDKPLTLRTDTMKPLTYSFRVDSDTCSLPTRARGSETVNWFALTTKFD